MNHPLMQHLPSARTGASGARIGASGARTGQGNGVAGVLGRMAAECPPYAGGLSCRHYYLGFDSEANNPGGIAAGATVTVVAQPQEPFVAEEIIVASTVSPFFVIEQILVGRTPQAIAASPVLAEVFSSASFRASMSLDPANRGTRMEIQVTNIDVNPRRFSGAFIGRSQGCA